MAVELNKFYEDTMQEDRFLMPVKEEDGGKKLVCKVYWEQGGRKNYGGTVSLSSALFYASSPTEQRELDWKVRQAKQFMDRVGFRLAGSGPKREPPKKPERKQERPRGYDDEDGGDDFRSRAMR